MVRISVVYCWECLCVQFLDTAAALREGWTEDADGWWTCPECAREREDQP